VEHQHLVSPGDIAKGGIDHKHSLLD